MERKGAKSTKDISSEVLSQLNRGTLETLTLSEGLSVDFQILLQAIRPEFSGDIIDRLSLQEGVVKRMKSAAQILYSQEGATRLEGLMTHPSDTVRGWSCYLIAEIPDLSLPERLSLVQPLADDSHFGVREWVWLAMRPHLSAEINLALTELTLWAKHSSPNIRRFASESIRPRGVWRSHIDLLKSSPEIALPLLETLKCDSSLYVQNSVANWLNDASKSKPDWVRSLCERWKTESPTAETAKICRRAMRSLI